MQHNRLRMPCPIPAGFDSRQAGESVPVFTITQNVRAESQTPLSGCCGGGNPVGVFPAGPVSSTGKTETLTVSTAIPEETGSINGNEAKPRPDIHVTMSQAFDDVATGNAARLSDLLTITRTLGVSDDAVREYLEQSQAGGNGPFSCWRSPLGVLYIEADSWGGGNTTVASVRELFVELER